MTKHYLLGQTAADFLKGQMANQTTEQLSGVRNTGRISGEVMPFEITGDWKKADGEEVYSCKAKQVWWNGERYVKDDTETAFEFTLYSPHDRDNQPGNAVGNTVFAVIRGNHWEVLGGGGGSSILFPVNMEIAGGGSGSSSLKCSYYYKIQHAISEEWWNGESWDDKNSAINVDPSYIPHKWTRTITGRYIFGTYGYASIHDITIENIKFTDKLIIGWCNEYPDTRGCT